MREESFVKTYQADWLNLEEVLEADKPQSNALQAFPAQYRELCHQLGIAKRRGYSPQVVNRLNLLATRGHQFLYEYRGGGESRWLEFLIYGFPQTVRNHRNYVLSAMLLFFAPLFIMGLLVFFEAEYIYTMMPAESVVEYEAMYDPGNRDIGRTRDAGTDVFMFGFYIINNISIGFRTFASGLLFGVGSIFILIYNGLAIGSVGGYLTQAGFSTTFYSFVAGHSAFELLAIVLSGAAGLKLGFSLLSPGKWRRLDALRIAAFEAVQVVFGAAAMLLVAAFIEAFWSSSSVIPVTIKYGVGISLWCLLAFYFCFVGRRRHAWS